MPPGAKPKYDPKYLKSIIVYKMVLFAKRISYRVRNIKWVSKIHVGQGCRRTLLGYPPTPHPHPHPPPPYPHPHPPPPYPHPITLPHHPPHYHPHPHHPIPPTPSHPPPTTPPPNLHINFVVEKYTKISLYFYSSFKAQDPRWLPNLRKNCFDMKSIDVPFLLVIF